jgi:hypothetical protein
MPLNKNTDLMYKEIQILTSYNECLKFFLKIHRVMVVFMLINVLGKVRDVNFSLLYSGFEYNAKFSINYKRIQRFFVNANIPMNLIAKLIFCLLSKKESLVLVMDRTNWKFGQNNINLLI